MPQFYKEMKQNVMIWENFLRINNGKTFQRYRIAGSKYEQKKHEQNLFKPELYSPTGGLEFNRLALLLNNYDVIKRICFQKNTHMFEKIKYEFPGLIKRMKKTTYNQELICNFNNIIR